MVTTGGNKPVRFQFLIGRLDTKGTAKSIHTVYSFQFLIGRLDTFKYRRKTESLHGVSIPHR